MRGVGREERRLRKVFGAALLAVLPAGIVAAACDASSDATQTTPDGADATTPPPPQAPDAPDPDSGDERPVLDDGACSTYGGPHDAKADAPDADPGCFYVLPCGFGDASQVEIAGCDVFTKDPTDAAHDAGGVYCVLREGDGCQADVYVPGPGGHLTLDCNDCFGGAGRRPAGLLRGRATGGRGRARSPLAAYFARMAHDEAASVHAFVRMKDELARFGAPRALVRAAARSADDEVRHARAMGALARACGARPRVPRVRRSAPRKLESMARENAVEGCVHETWGALLLAWQAARAADPAVRRTFARIADDETRHAALSWAVARFAEERLDRVARARVVAARRRAMVSLRGTLARAPARPFDGRVGRPSSREALALFDALAAGLSG